MEIGATAKERKRVSARRYYLKHREAIIAKAKKYYEEHREQVLAYQRRYVENHRGPDWVDGRSNTRTEEERVSLRRARARRHHHKHREQRNEANRAYREEHKEKVAAQRRKYRQSEEGKAVERAYAANHREEIRGYYRKYISTERGRAMRRAKENRRRTRKAALPVSFTERDWEVALAHFSNLCAYCGVQDGPLQQDHVIPISLGGGYVRENIVPACKSCNSSKNNMPLDEWIIGRGGALVQSGVAERIRAYLGQATPISYFGG